MAIKNIPLEALLVNRANDRHGELENETAAIAWLFNARDQHMRNLARDIVDKGETYEMPLVSPDGDYFVVFDGNRRVTCLKLLDDPRRAPTVELQTFFRELRSKWSGQFPERIQCEVEPDRDRIDEILYRRHTGTQNGVGQSTWDDRMKANFVARTGKRVGVNVADEIERRLREADLLPARRKIPRSTMNRLLSAEPLRSRLGFSINGGRFQFTHQEDVVLSALARVASDLATRKLVLGDIWDTDDKTTYLDSLQEEGILPSAEHLIPRSGEMVSQAKSKSARRPTRAIKSARTTLIPQKDFSIIWPGRLQRHHEIWDELQFGLELARHPNAISVLFRVLLELSVENYIKQTGLSVYENDKLAARVLKVAKDQNSKAKIDQKQLGALSKFQQIEHLVSADTLNRYVHSPNFAPSPQHLMAIWDALADFVVECLRA